MIDEPTPEQRVSARDRANKLADFWATRDDISLSADAVFDLEQSFLALIVEERKETERLRAELRDQQRIYHDTQWRQLQECQTENGRLRADNEAMRPIVEGVARRWREILQVAAIQHCEPDGVGFSISGDIGVAAEAIVRKEEPSDASN